MNLGDLAGRLGVHLAELMAPVAVGFGIGCLRQALARLKEQRFRQLAWEAMIYAERRFASGPERLDYVSRYLARRTGLPPTRIRHLVESLVAQVERELVRGPEPAPAAQ